MSSALASLGPGVVFARDFRIVRALAEGGMGGVFVAEQISSGKLRALKVLNPDLVSDPQSREQFTLEARIGGQIGSGHVVEVIAAGVDEETEIPYLAMELLEGEDLHDLVSRRGAVAPHEVLEIFEQLGDALTAAHRAGVIHRDLKPRNIFVARSRLRGMPFVVKVLDFGISKVLANNVTSVTVTRQLGSPLFMAPEQARSGAKLRRSTDVWPLGLLAYLLLTGRHYWRAVEEDGVNLNALLMEVVVHPIDPPGLRAMEQGIPAGTLPPGFDEWFARCIERDPERRFAEAGEAVEGLRAVLRGRHAMMMESEATVVRALPGVAASGAYPIAADTAPRSLPPPPTLVTRAPTMAPAIGPPPGVVGAGELTGPTPGGAVTVVAPLPQKPRSRWVWGLAVVAALAVVVAVAVPSKSQAPATASPTVALHFVGVPAGGSVFVGDRRFDGAEVVVPRSAATAVVRVEAPGRRAVTFALTPDHEQRVVLPEMQADPVVEPALVIEVDAAAEALPVQQTIETPDAGPGPDEDGGAVEIEEPAARVVRRAVGRLTVGADPPRCEVSIDGRAAGRSPVFNQAVSAGEHRVRCVRPDGRAMQRLVRVPAGRETEVIFPAE